MMQAVSDGAKNTKVALKYSDCIEQYCCLWRFRFFHLFRFPLSLQNPAAASANPFGDIDLAKMDEMMKTLFSGMGDPSQLGAGGVWLY
jgi:hypothetical protein